MSNQTPAAAPDGIAESHIKPVAGWRRHASPLSLVVFGAVVVLAMTGFLGHEREWIAEGSGTTMSVHMPEVIRNGEFFEIRVALESDRPIVEPVIGIDQAIWEDMTINTLIPAATDESSENGEFRFTFAELPAATPFLFKIDAQVNPDILGGNDGRVAVYDGDELIADVHVGIWVLP